VKRISIIISFLCVFLSILYGEPMEISILRASMKPENLNMVAAVVIRVDEESYVSYDLGETILISNPNYKMPELEDEADVVFLIENVVIKNDYVFLRAAESGTVFYLSQEDIVSVHPVIPDSSMFKRFMERLGGE